MNAAQALEEARQQVALAQADLVEFLSARLRDPRSLTDHVKELLELKIQRLQATTALMTTRLNHVISSPLAQFIPARPEDIRPPSRWQPLSGEDWFFLEHPQFRRGTGPTTWSTDGTARSDSPVPPGFEI